MRMGKIPGSRQKRTKDVEILLDEALDDECQGRKFWKNVKGRRGILLFINSEIWHLK